MIGAACLALFAWLISRDADQTNEAGRRWKLNLLRVLGLLILMLGLLRPAYVKTDRLPMAATVTVLLDSSRSMTLAANSRKSRWQVQHEVWREIAPALAAAGESIEVRILSYDSELIDHNAADMEAFLKESPKGDSTDVAGALAGVLRSASGKPLAAVVLLGDGAQTVETDGSAAVATARSLAALNVPLWTVPIGPRVSAGQTQDLAMQDMSDQYRVFTRNRFEVRGTLQAHGFAGRSLPVQLSLIDRSGKRTLLATREVVPKNVNEAVPVRIDLTAPEPGSYRIELAAKQQDGEILNGNNAMTAFLDVREGGGRVLYLEGQASIEQKFIRRSINDSDDLQLSFRWLEPKGGKWQTINLQNELNGDRYDVFVIGDIPAVAFGNEQLERLATLVSQGKSLLMTGGFQSFDAGGYGETPLAKVLPVVMAKGLVTNPEDRRFVLPGPLRPDAPVLHPITMLTDTGDNPSQWKRLPTIGTASRLGQPRAVPGVEVLLVDDERHPLLVIGEHGKGRTAALALDSTWQWWMKRQATTHRRFWRQMLLWLLARDNRETGKIWVELDRRRWITDQKVEFRAGLDDPNAKDISLLAEAIPEQGPPIPININEGFTGENKTVVGHLSELPPGFYVLRISTAAPDVTPGEIAFQVISADRELARPNPDIAQLEQLAGITASAGGQAYEPEKLEALLEKLRALNQIAAVPIVKRYRLGDGPLSGSILLLLLLGVLSAEWTLRKHWQLP